MTEEKQESASVSPDSPPTADDSTPKAPSGDEGSEPASEEVSEAPASSPPEARLEEESDSRAAEPETAGTRTVEPESAGAQTVEPEPATELDPEGEAEVAKSGPQPTVAGRVAQPGRRAQPVTVTMLKAAARSPEDVKEIVRVESRLREKQRVEPAAGPETASEKAPTGVEAANFSPAKPAAQKPAAQKPAAQKSTAQKSTAQKSTAQKSTAQKPAPQKPAPQKPAPQSPQARAPKPGPPRRADPAPAAGPVSSPRAPTAERAPAPAAGRTSSWPVAAAIVITGATLTWAIRSNRPPAPQGSAAPAVAAATPSPRTGRAPALGPVLPTRRGTLASFGGDRVVYTDGSGELVVLKGDGVSGELTLERVYVVRRDRQRDLGDPGRSLHGVYLDDLHRERAGELKAATLEFRTRLEEARRRGEGVELVDAAAARLARAGGADLLIPLLDPTYPTLDRRAATIGLIESGYRCALPHVATLIRRYAGGPRGRSLSELSERLIGETLDPNDPSAAASAIEAWCQSHPLQDRFEQIKPH